MTGNKKLHLCVCMCVREKARERERGERDRERVCVGHAHAFVQESVVDTDILMTLCRCILLLQTVSEKANSVQS